MPTGNARTQTAPNQSDLSIPSEAVPALTVLWHPDLARVGATFSMDDVAEGCPLLLSRNSPEFALHGERPRPLDDSFLSRQPFLGFTRTADGVDVAPGVAKCTVQLDGKPLLAKERLSLSDRSRAFVITLARRIVLCLHAVASPARVPRIDDLGMLGGSDAIEGVRRAIRAMADLDLPVLIRGETGTGKELVAAALVKASPRAGKPFVAVNLAALPTSLAVAELVGRERGAFTGATESRKGYFGEADGGTLFLDEIGLADSDVQTALLRILETGEVRTIGSKAAKRADVRLLAATDAQLEECVDAGTFSRALFHRLSAFEICLPALRDRRQDIGILFLHFLRQILAKTGELARLEMPITAKRTWLMGDAMTLVALAPWPGNVRQLRNFAAQLAAVNRGAEAARLDPALLTVLAPGNPGPVAVPPKAKSGGSRVKAAQISRESLLDALERHDFRTSRAARDLGISRTTLYEHIQRDPELRKASDIPEAELQRLNHEFQGDLDRLSKRLRISVRALKLRLARSA
jgi:two-component system nitrogen regulation response regulator GlnG